MKTDIEQRLADCRELLATWDVDALLIGSPANRRWLSGFTGSAGWLLITASEALITTDFRYWEQAQKQAPVYTLVRNQGSERLPSALIQETGVKQIAFEGTHLSVDEFETLKERAGLGVSWLRQKNTVEELRAIKTADEVALIRRAAAITDQAVSLVPQLARPGVTERELAWALEKAMREAGADGVAFDIIVASGPNAALPHHHPGDRPLRAGDAIVVDLGALLEGYHSDLTRTFFLGDEPSAEFNNIYRLVRDAQQNVLAHMRSGMTSQAIDALARDVIVAAGHEEHFGHGLGHGVGLEIHESPSFSRYLPDVIIPAGVVATVEPGVYLPGWGGVRIEDLVLLGTDGAELLSAAPKEPLIPIS